MLKNLLRAASLGMSLYGTSSTVHAYTLMMLLQQEQPVPAVLFPIDALMNLVVIVKSDKGKPKKAKKRKETKLLDSDGKEKKRSNKKDDTKVKVDSKFSEAINKNLSKDKKDKDSKKKKSSDGFDFDDEKKSKKK